MNWLLTIAATCASLVAFWLYGNKSWMAPLFGIIGCLIYVYYDIRYDQVPLLVPTFVTMGIQIRNLIRMRNAR